MLRFAQVTVQDFFFLFDIILTQKIRFEFLFQALQRCDSAFGIYEYVLSIWYDHFFFPIYFKIVELLVVYRFQKFPKNVRGR